MEFIKNMDNNEGLINPNIKMIKPFLRKEYRKILYVYYTNPDTGKRTKKSTKTRIRAEAQKLLDLYLNQYYLGTPSISISGNKRISDLRNLIFDVNSNRMSSSTFSLYNLAFDHFIKIIGNKQVSSITKYECDKYINELIPGRSANTVNIYFRNMRTAFNTAIDYGMITINPFKKMKEFETPENTRPRISIEELEKLFNVIDNAILQRVVKFALLTGMRLGEITYLQWEDIDFNERIIHVKNKSNHKTKTRKDRDIPLIEPIYNILFTPQKSKIFDLKAKEEYVFSKDNGEKFTNEYISRKFKQYVKKANINDKICFHCLRHTTGTILAKSNIPMKLLQSLLGHSSQTTTALYLHTDIEDMRQFMEKVDYGFNITK